MDLMTDDLDEFDLFCSVLCPLNKNSKHETTVKWKTVNPEFHEQFVYLTSSTELPKQSLHITVWDRGKNRPDKYAGKYIVHLLSSKVVLKMTVLMLALKL